MAEPPSLSRSITRSTRSSARRMDSGSRGGDNATPRGPPPPPPPPRRPPAAAAQQPSPEENVEETLEQWSEVVPPPVVAGAVAAESQVSVPPAAAGAANAPPVVPPLQQQAEGIRDTAAEPAGTGADAPPAFEGTTAETENDNAAATEQATVEQNAGNDNNNAAPTEQHTNDNVPPPRDWILMVRSHIRQRSSLESQKQQQSQWRSTSIVVRILVTPTMTEARLGRCIVQASCASSTLLPDERPAAGLFREKDGLFVPLEIIMANPNKYRRDVWTLDPNSCMIWNEWQVAQTTLLDLVKRWLAVLCVIVISVVAFYLLDEIQAWFHISLSFLWQLPPLLMRKLIDVPLRELYRYGPSMVGWEGQSLARICARITYHGDESFWSRNIQECERIFHAKEEAYLRISRPVVYVILGYMLYQVLKTLVTLHAERRRWRPDTDMVETYRAFNVLVGQMGRSLAKRAHRAD